MHGQTYLKIQDSLFIFLIYTYYGILVISKEGLITDIICISLTDVGIIRRRDVYSK
jgi:hypothetical protein